MKKIKYKHNLRNKKIEKIDIDSKIEIATQTLERNIGFITNCDNKTSIVLTIVGVFLTVIFTNDKFIKAIILIINKCMSNGNCINIILFLLLLFSIVKLFYGMYKLASVLTAKISGDSNNEVSKNNSMIFFSGINSRSYQDYHSKFYLMSKKELFDELISQIYINSYIASEKYNNFNLGLRQISIGLVIFIVVLLLSVYIY